MKRAKSELLALWRFVFPQTKSDWLDLLWLIWHVALPGLLVYALIVGMIIAGGLAQ